MKPVDVFFGDGTKSLQFTPDLILELERKTGMGIGALSRRFYAGQFAFADLTELLRLGLIGGGTDPEEAHGLVTTYGGRMAVMDLYQTCLPLMDALMFGTATTKTEEKADA